MGAGRGARAYLIKGEKEGKWKGKGWVVLSAWEAMPARGKVGEGRDGWLA